MSKKIEPIDKFNSLLVEYLNTFNQLEKNIGHCIAHLEDSSIKNSYKFLAKTNCEKKIEKLYEIVKSKKKLKSENDLRELEDWCEKAHQMRHQRNKYIHGQWSLLPHLEKGVELSVAPWVKEQYGDSVRMSLKELSIIVQEIEDCFEQLMVIRKNNDIFQ